MFPEVLLFILNVSSQLFQTYVGSYLIFLNPHKRLTLCSNDAIKLYAQRSLFKLPPHV